MVGLAGSIVTNGMLPFRGNTKVEPELYLINWHLTYRISTPSLFLDIYSILLYRILLVFVAFCMLGSCSLSENCQGGRLLNELCLTAYTWGQGYTLLPMFIVCTVVNNLVQLY